VEEDLFHKESESKVAKIIRLNRFLVQEGIVEGVGKVVGGTGLRGWKVWMDVVKLFRCVKCGHEHSDKTKEYMVEMVYHKVSFFRPI
jgi:hypothetical protein